MDRKTQNQGHPAVLNLPPAARGIGAMHAHLHPSSSCTRGHPAWTKKTPWCGSVSLSLRLGSASTLQARQAPTRPALEANTKPGSVVCPALWPPRIRLRHRTCPASQRTADARSVPIPGRGSALVFGGEPCRLSFVGLERDFGC